MVVNFSLESDNADSVSGALLQYRLRSGRCCKVLEKGALKLLNVKMTDEIAGLEKTIPKK